MLNTQSRWLSGLLLIVLLAMTYQNCGEFRPVGGTVESSSTTGSGTFTGDPSSTDIQALLAPNLVNDCWDNPNYNACIFWKNPVAQEGNPFSSAITGSTPLSSVQNHAVNIYGYDNSGFLRNNSVAIYSYNESSRRYESLSTRSGEFKFPYENDPQNRFSQVMAYHWLMTLGAFMHYETGAFYAENRNITVISYVPGEENAYWDPQQNQIQIGSTNSGNQLALSAEVYAHEAGHANAHYATGGAIYETVGSAKSIRCQDTVCCSDADGCSWAIDEGQSDYHYAVLFPNDTDMLESYTNTNTGVVECGRSRSLDANINLTSPTAYGACGTNYQGEVHVMGRVYASAWWVVRKQVITAFGSSKEIDVLFTAHLAALEGRDDFQTALDKILSTDNALFGGKYSNYFRQEFARRGIF